MAEVSRPFRAVGVGLPLMGPTSTFQVADAASRVSLLTNRIRSRKDRIIIGTDLKNVARQRNLEMLAKVISQNPDQARVAHVTDFPLNPGVEKAKSRSAIHHKKNKFKLQWKRRKRWA